MNLRLLAALRAACCKAHSQRSAYWPCWGEPADQACIVACLFLPGAREVTLSLDSQLLQRLQRKRAAVEKELSRVPGAPKNSKDVFTLCRGFERAFSYTVDVSAVARHDGSQPTF